MTAITDPLKALADAIFWQARLARFELAMKSAFKFDPNQARDDHGKWTDGGSGGSGSSDSNAGSDAANASGASSSLEKGRSFLKSPEVRAAGLAIVAGVVAEFLIPAIAASAGAVGAPVLATAASAAVAAYAIRKAVTGAVALSAVILGVRKLRELYGEGKSKSADPFSDGLTAFLGALEKIDVSDLEDGAAK